MNTADKVLHELIELCKAESIFPVDDLAGLADEDLFELGLVDSLSLTLLQVVIEEAFAVAIPAEVLVGELRSLRDTAAHIQASERAATAAA
jgi:acyl carrier protein